MFSLIDSLHLDFSKSPDLINETQQNSLWRSVAFTTTTSNLTNFEKKGEHRNFQIEEINFGTLLSYIRLHC